MKQFVTLLFIITFPAFATAETPEKKYPSDQPLCREDSDCRPLGRDYFCAWNRYRCSGARLCFDRSCEQRPNPTSEPPALSMWDVVQPYVEIRSADQKSSIEETCANYSQDEWVVKGEDGRIAVSRRQVSPTPTPQALPFDIAPADNAAQMVDVEDGLHGELRFEKVADGYLLGFNAGERGGALWWFSPDGKERKRLGTENSHGFVRLKDGVYALTGLAHLSGDEGSLVKLTQESSRNWKATEAANLGGAPEAFTQDSDGDVFVVTPKKVIRISSDAKIETIHSAKIDWGVLYPTSIVKADDGKIYIGMRYAVARLTPENGTYKEEWLVPKKCHTWELLPNNLKCVCRD